MTTPLLDQAQALGRAVEDGSLSREEAVASLVEWSNGGLTHLGASDLIDRWKAFTPQLSSRQAAGVAGVAASTWRDYVADGRAPRPDGKIGNSNWWYRSTVEQWKANRPGRGARTDLQQD